MKNPTPAESIKLEAKASSKLMFQSGTFEPQKIQQSITHHSCWQWPEKVNKEQSSLPTLGVTPDVANLLRVHYSKCSPTFLPRPWGVLNPALSIIYSWEISAWVGSPPPRAVSHLFTKPLLTLLLPTRLTLNSVPYYMHWAEISMHLSCIQDFIPGPACLHRMITAQQSFPYTR